LLADWLASEDGHVTPRSAHRTHSNFLFELTMMINMHAMILMIITGSLAAQTSQHTIFRDDEGVILGSQTQPASYQVEFLLLLTGWGAIS
jgi:hypothetical protein